MLFSSLSQCISNTIIPSLVILLCPISSDTSVENLLIVDMNELNAFVFTFTPIVLSVNDLQLLPTGIFTVFSIDWLSFAYDPCAFIIGVILTRPSFSSRSNMNSALMATLHDDTSFLRNCDYIVIVPNMFILFKSWNCASSLDDRLIITSDVAPLSTPVLVDMYILESLESRFT